MTFTTQALRSTTQSAGKSTVAVSQTSQVRGPRFQRCTCRGGRTQAPQDFTLQQKTSLKPNGSPGTLCRDEEQPWWAIVREERCPPRVEIKVADDRGWDSLRRHHGAQRLSNVLCIPVRELLSERKGFTPEKGVGCNWGCEISYCS